MKDQSFWRQAWHALIRDTPAFSPSREQRRRELARAVFRLGGLLSRIQFKQRTYTVTDWDTLATEPAGRYRGPIPPAMWLLTLSERLDPYHWEHWALVHDDDLSAYPCLVCGGFIDPEPEDDALS